MSTTNPTGVSRRALLAGAAASEHDRKDQAVRFGSRKGVRPKDGPVELHHLSQDAGESTDLAARHPALVRKAERLLADAVSGG
jgi:hypothetical protein